MSIPHYYLSQPGRDFHGLAGDTPIFESKHVWVDQNKGDDKVFVEVGAMDRIRGYLPRSEAVAMAKAILERLEPGNG